MKTVTFHAAPRAPRRGRVLGLIASTTLWVAGCANTTTGSDGGADTAVNDAPQAGPDAARADAAGALDAGSPGADAGALDAGPPGADAGAPDAGPPGADAGAPDAPADGTSATCPTTTAVDPSVFLGIQDNAFVFIQDTTPQGGMPGTPNTLFRVKAVQATPTTRDTVHNCVQYPISRGTMARANADALNYGNVTLAEGTMYSELLTWMAGSPAIYSGDPTMLIGTLPGMPVALTVAGGPDGPAGAASLVLPPAVTAWDPGATFHATFTDPANPTLSTTADTVVSWTAPTTDTGPDLVAFYQSYDLGNGGLNMVMCAVPACAGQMTVPAALTSAYMSGASLQITIGFGRTTLVAPASTTQPVHFTVGSTAVYMVGIP